MQIHYKYNSNTAQKQGKYKTSKKKTQCKYNTFTPLPGVTEANDFKRDCKSQSKTKIGGEFANICKQICPNFAFSPFGLLGVEHSNCSLSTLENLVGENVC